jgi:hypothetical protein
MAPNKVAIGDAAAGDVATGDVGIGGAAATGGAPARLVGSSVPRIARHAIAPAERTSDPASCASAVRIAVSNASSWGVRSGGFGVTVVSLMMFLSSDAEWRYAATRQLTRSRVAIRAR